jgi:hypothetical protein
MMPRQRLSLKTSGGLAGTACCVNGQIITGLHRYLCLVGRIFVLAQPLHKTYAKVFIGYCWSSSIRRWGAAKMGALMPQQSQVLQLQSIIAFFKAWMRVPVESLSPP